MFSGKTTELIRQCRKHVKAGKRVLKVKFVADKRFGDDITIVTHGGVKSSAIAVSKLQDLGDKFMDYDVIGVDEGQFFVDVLEFAEKASNANKIVIVSSLQATFLRGEFPVI